MLVCDKMGQCDFATLDFAIFFQQTKNIYNSRSLSLTPVSRPTRSLYTNSVRSRLRIKSACESATMNKVAEDMTFTIVNGGSEFAGRHSCDISFNSGSNSFFSQTLPQKKGGKFRPNNSYMLLRGNDIGSMRRKRTL